MKKTSWFGDIGKNVSKLAQIRHFHIFVKNDSRNVFLKLVLNMTFNLNETYFQKNLQFGDIWPRNRQKIAQIEVFGNFLNFALLVFLAFAQNDKRTWCLVVFLQFIALANIFLLNKSFTFLLRSSKNFTMHNYVVEKEWHLQKLDFKGDSVVVWFSLGLPTSFDLSKVLN